jgi:sugar lactone lactonase YvrE
MYLVSNINGNPLEKDNNGFISHVGPDGAVHSLKWIEGGRDGVTLHAPKGLGISGDTLFVADIDVVRLFNRTTGAAMSQRAIRGATFLNDIAVGPDGKVYVTDMGMRGGAQGFEPSGTAAIWTFGARGAATPFARGESLGAPNGLAADSAGLTVVTFDGNQVFRLSAGGARVDLPGAPAGQLDGVVALPDGGLLISSWEGQAIYRLHPEGVYSTAVDSIASPADIGFDSRRNAVLIPVFTENRVEVRGIETGG